MFGNLHLLLVDPRDIAVGKLFSAWVKDRDDVRARIDRIDQDQLESHVRLHGLSLWSDLKLRGQAPRNWYIRYGSALKLPNG
jgi:hypothetical protein